MNTKLLAPFLCMAALCLLPSHANTVTPPNPTTPLEQFKSIADSINKAMNGMILAIEQVNDEKSAQEAADSIVSSTKKVEESANSGRELYKKLSENDKKEMEKTLEQMQIAKYYERFSKASKGLADKPELLKILRPARAAFSRANIRMGPVKNDKNLPIRVRDKGAMGARGNIVE